MGNFRETFKKATDEKSLKELISDGIASIHGNTVTLSVQNVREIFINEINILFAIYDKEITASLSNDNKLILTYKNNLPLVFELNFTPNSKFYSDKIIHFCKIYQSNYFLYWLDVINDVNTFKMFVSYIKNEFEYLSYQQRISFNFFDELSSDVVSEIFNISIKSYFENLENMIFEETDFIDLQHIKKFIKKDNVEFFKISINKKSLIIVRNENRIEFLSIVLNKIYYPTEINDIIYKLRNALILKVSEYRKLQLIGTTNVLRDSNSGVKLLLSLSGLFLIPINLTIFSFNLGIIAKILSFAVTIFLIMMVIIWIILPSFRILKFTWKINEYSKNKKNNSIFRINNYS